MARIASSTSRRNPDAQHETNLHNNMVVAGVKVNKLVFSQLLFVCAALFLLVLPAARRRHAGIASVVERLGVPVPRLLHVVTVVGCFAIVGLVPSHRRDELLELGASASFLWRTTWRAWATRCRGISRRGHGRPSCS